MADESEDERTEAPTDRRMNMAWDEGQIPLSKDVVQFAGFLAGVVALIALAAPIRDSLIGLVVVSARTLGNPEVRNLGTFAAAPLKQALLVCAAAMVASVVTTLIQTRARMWTGNLVKGIELSGAAIKRLVSKDVFVDLGLALVKAVTVGWAAWSGLEHEFLTLPALLVARSDVQLAMMWKPLVSASAKVLAALFVLAGLDLALTRYRHRKSLKMTKQDVKRESREEEGDPMLRGRRKRKHREMLKNMARVEVPRADALLVNPTHIAIAIRYRPGKDRAPVVTAKGKGELAEYMRELARSHGIPIVEDIPLARLLYKKVKIGRSVPAETYKAIAAILAFVYRVTGRRPATATPLRTEARP